jgi:hypothetical protein
MRPIAASKSADPLFPCVAAHSLKRRPAARRASFLLQPVIPTSLPAHPQPLRGRIDLLLDEPHRWHWPRMRSRLRARFVGTHSGHCYRSLLRLSCLEMDCTPNECTGNTGDWGHRESVQLLWFGSNEYLGSPNTSVPKFYSDMGCAHSSRSDRRCLL